ncbi:hypothetical protein ACRRTK_017702 [Alexandromys fortis]
MKWPLASTAEHMRATSSLLLPVLLAEVCLVTSLNFSSHLPEAQAELESQDPQNQTWVPSDEEEEEYWLRTSQQQLSNETSNFGFSLLRKISMRHDGNVIFSPFGLSVAMVNLMLGAKGETRVQADNFHLDKYKAVKVPMMYREGNFASTFDKKFRCHILKLPYQGNATMLVVLTEKTGDHLALEDYLTIDLVETWLQDMKTRKMEVFFPKFKLDQRYEMHKLLQQMGIRKIFSTSADLSELSAVARNLQVLQQSVLEVDERGTEAVAGTLSEIVAYSMPPVIKVNRPFHFMIYEEMSKMLLFLGRNSQVSHGYQTLTSDLTVLDEWCYESLNGP